MNFVSNTLLRLLRPIRQPICTQMQWHRLRIEFQLLRIEQLLSKRGIQRDFKNVKCLMLLEVSKLVVLFSKFQPMANSAELSEFKDKYLKMAHVAHSNEQPIKTFLQI